MGPRPNMRPETTNYMAGNIGTKLMDHDLREDFMNLIPTVKINEWD